MQIHKAEFMKLLKAHMDKKSDNCMLLTEEEHAHRIRVLSNYNQLDQKVRIISTYHQHLFTLFSHEYYDDNLLRPPSWYGSGQGPGQ